MSAPHPRGSAYSWEENRDGSRARLDKIGIVIHTGGVDDRRPRVPQCDGYLYVGSGGSFDFRDPEHPRGRGRCERDPDSGFEYIRSHDGFCGYMQAAMIRSAGVDPRAVNLSKLNGTMMLRFVQEFGEKLRAVVEAAELR